ncbi:nucleoside transporter [Moniliophthora roreri MCA 2997]|nr:nucleoside transporter [Moniliophthora roreri MCA 2997]KAI3596718.1 nucleoside transporter [Moniliophthora roreri]
MSSSPDALYHAIPQAPVASNPIRISEHDPDPPIDLDEELEPLAPVPVDARIRGIHFVLGCAVLLPWNALITATPYFLSRLEDSPLRSTFSSYFSISFTSANFFFLAHATATSKQSSPSRQTIFSLLWLAVLCFLLTLSTLVQISPGPFFAFVILNGIVQAAFGSYLQTSVIAVASLFGPTAVQAMLSGQAAVAVAVSTVQVLSASASVSVKREGRPVEGLSRDKNPEERAAFIFFGLSTVFLLVTVVAQWWLTRMPQYHAVAGSLEVIHKTGRDGADERRGLVSGGRSDPSIEKTRIIRVAKTNIIYEVAVAYVFIVTLAVFPPITASIQPTNPNLHPLLFTSIHFLTFGLGDFVGRYICSFPQVLIWSARKLLTLSLSRTLFVFLFLMCNVTKPSAEPSQPLINSDFLFFLILFAFGLSNGYVSSLCLMSASSLEHNPRLKGKREDVDVAATVSQFCLIGGLMVGSMASFVVRSAVCSCNPFTT